MGNTLLIRYLQLQDTKDCKIQKLREFAVRPCLLGMLEATPIKSHHHDCLNQDDTKRHVKMESDEPKRTQPRTKNYRQLLSNTGKNTLSHYPLSNDQP